DTCRPEQEDQPIHLINPQTQAALPFFSPSSRYRISQNDRRHSNRQKDQVKHHVNSACSRIQPKICIMKGIDYIVNLKKNDRNSNRQKISPASLLQNLLKLSFLLQIHSSSAKYSGNTHLTVLLPQ